MLCGGVIAIALVALQGCAGATVTASSLGIPVAGLGPLRADPPVRSTATRERAESSPSPRERERNVRVYSVCHRCSP